MCFRLEMKVVGSIEHQDKTSDTERSGIFTQVEQVPWIKKQLASETPFVRPVFICLNRQSERLHCKEQLLNLYRLCSAEVEGFGFIELST